MEGKWTRSFHTHPGPEKARHIRVGESFSNFHCKVLNKRPNPTHVLIHRWGRTQARKVQPRVTWAFLLMDDPDLSGIFLPSCLAPQQFSSLCYLLSLAIPTLRSFKQVTNPTERKNSCFIPKGCLWVSRNKTIPWHGLPCSPTFSEKLPTHSRKSTTPCKLL